MGEQRQAAGTSRVKRFQPPGLPVGRHIGLPGRCRSAMDFRRFFQIRVWPEAAHGARRLQDIPAYRSGRRHPHRACRSAGRDSGWQATAPRSASVRCAVSSATRAAGRHHRRPHPHLLPCDRDRGALTEALWSLPSASGCRALRSIAAAPNAVSSRGGRPAHLQAAWPSMLTKALVDDFAWVEDIRPAPKASASQFAETHPPHAAVRRRLLLCGSACIRPEISARLLLDVRSAGVPSSRVPVIVAVGARRHPLLQPRRRLRFRPQLVGDKAFEQATSSSRLRYPLRRDCATPLPPAAP